MKKLFSEQDHARIKEAVLKAETRTGAEIVPVIVSQSDLYEEALWRGAGLTAVLSAGTYLLSSWMGWLWFPVAPLYFFMSLIAVGGTAYLLTYRIPFLKRLFAGRSLMELRCRQRARQVFLEEEVFRTSNRTGILIFLSLLEHAVVVLGDSGINARIKQEDWKIVVDLITAGIKNGNPIGGLEKAIEQCGQLTAKLGIDMQPGDKNELADTLRGSSK